MNDIREDLKAYIDGELSQARAQEVEAAMASDPALQQEVHFMRMLGFEIKKAAHEAPIKGATETIAKLRKPKTSLLRMPLVPVAFGAMALIGISMVIYPMVSGGAAEAAEVAVSTQATESPRGATEKLGGAIEAEAGLNPPPSSSRYGNANRAKAQKGGADMLPEMKAGGGAGAAGMEDGVGQAPNNSWYRGAEAAKSGMTLESKGNRVIDKDSKTTTPSEVHKVFKQPKLIRDADMSVKVESVHKAQDKISDIAKKLNGFLSNTALNVQADKTPEATTTFRVPVENFDAALIEIRNMGEVISESSKSDDVTAEVADKESRIVTLADLERSLIAELNKTKDAQLKFQIRSRIDNIRVELASIKAQYKALRDIADYSTINLKFVGRPQGEDPRTGESWSNDTWTSATNSSKTIGRFFGAIGMYLLAYAPFWIPVLFVGWLIARRRSV